MRTSVFPAIVLATVTWCITADCVVTEPATWTNQRLKEFSDRQAIINPKGDNVYQKVHELFGATGPYTDDQIRAALNPKHKVEKPYDPSHVRQRGTVPVDAFSRATTLRQLADYQKTVLDLEKLLTYTAPPSPEHPNGVKLKAKDLQDALEQKYGIQDWYKRDQVLDVETNGIAPGKVEREWPAGTPISEVIGRGGPPLEAKPVGIFGGHFKAPHIRQSWRDVLYEEDPSQASNEGKALKDLVGATVSYTRDGVADSDTWTTIGALIFPWEYDFELTGDLRPTRLVLAPSISINRIDTNGDPKKETDSVLYRLGAYADWRFFRPNPDGSTQRPKGVQIRAAFVYATDTGHEASLPGYEFDIEPHWQSDYFPLGYKKILLTKQPIKEDRSDWSRLEYTLRAWLHIEGGDIQDNGKSWDPAKGSFFRLGPTVQFQLNAPKLLVGRDASLTALYSYLPAVSGSDEHESYFKITGAYNLIKDEAVNHKVALTLQYEKGGLNFTKEDVDTVTIGLGVVF